jgi:hypothetical protein
MAPPQLLQNSWVRIGSSECEKRILELFVVSTSMHLMKGAFALILVNNTLIVALGYILLRGLQPWQILVLALVENLHIFNVSKYVGDASISVIETISSIKRDVVFFNITTGIFYLYIFLRLQLEHNQIIFLLSNSIMRGVYVIRYGEFIPNQRVSFLRKYYIALLSLLAGNIIVSVFRHKNE